MSGSSITALNGGDARPFLERNRTSLLTVTALAGLAVGLVALGVIIASMGTSPDWYYRFNSTGFDANGLPICTAVDGSGTQYTYEYIKGLSIPVELNGQVADGIQSTCTQGAIIGGIALGPCIAGFVIFAIALVSRYYAKKKDEEANRGVERIDPEKASSRFCTNLDRRALILVVVGLSLALFSVGMLIASTTISHRGVDEMKHLIEEGQQQCPDAGKAYDPYFWDNLKSDWLNPTERNMNGILAASVVGMIAGGGMMVLGLFGKTISNCYKCCNDPTRKEEQNPQVESESDKI